MRYFLIMSLATVLLSCKIGQSSTGGQGAAASAERNGTMRSDQYLVNAKVLFEGEGNLYTLRIYQVLETGTSFSQALGPGDKIEIFAPFPLPIKETIDLTIHWVSEGDSGHYEMSTGAE